MKTVWKFNLPVHDRSRIEMPKGAQVLHVDCQEPATIQLWALVDSDAEYIERFFRVAGTGHSLSDRIDDQKFVGTVVDKWAGLVWHIWYD